MSINATRQSEPFQKTLAAYEK